MFSFYEGLQLNDPHKPTQTHTHTRTNLHDKQFDSIKYGTTIVYIQLFIIKLSAV